MITKSTGHILLSLVLGTAISQGGCAPAYHCYSNGHVPCRYCPPAPLPYTSYPACACHSSQAAKYLKDEANTNAPRQLDRANTNAPRELAAAAPQSPTDNR